MPLLLWSQVPADFAFAWDSKSEQAIFATVALKQVLDKPNYIFLAVSGNNKAFSVYTKSGNTALPTGLMAQWIAANIKPKNIVLLSSASGKLIQELTKDLATLDLKAGRELRTILSWTEDVLLYANGHIKGYGICNEYRYDVALKQVVVTAVAETAIPYGNAYAKDTDYMILNQSQNVWIDWLETWPNRKERPVMQIAVRDLKASIKDTPKAPLYDLLIQNKNCFTGWTYLWELDYTNSPYIPQFDFLCKVSTICERYTRNQRFSALKRKNYEASFVQFLKLGKKSALSYLTEEDNLTLTEFKAQVKKTIEAETLADFFKKAQNANITDVLEKKIAIIGDSEPKLATELGNKTWSSNSLFPEPLWKTLRAFVENYSYTYTKKEEEDILLETIRGELIAQINVYIGTGAGILDKDKDGNLKGLDIILLRKITDMKSGIITKQGSRGSIFEHWVRARFDKLCGAKNEGKQTFYLEVTEGKNAAGNTIEIRIPIAGKPPVDDKNYQKRMIDCGYKEPLKSGETATSELVAVELKHISGKLTSESIEQLNDNIALVAAGKMKRIEYIFSTQQAAIENQSIFAPILTKNPGSVNAFYIDDNQRKPFKLF